MLAPAGKRLHDDRLEDAALRRCAPQQVHAFASGDHEAEAPVQNIGTGRKEDRQYGTGG